MTPMERYMAILPLEEAFTLGCKLAMEALEIQFGSLESVEKRLSHGERLFISSRGNESVTNKQAPMVSVQQKSYQ